MANTPGVCYTFKTDVLKGVHAFQSATGGKGAADTFKGALYLTAASPAIANTTTAFTTTGEVPASGTYALGGQIITTNTVANTLGVAYWTPGASLSWTGFTGTNFDTLLIYNNTVAGNNAVAVYTFSNQIITAGTFTLTMPTNDAVTGLLRLSGT